MTEIGKTAALLLLAMLFAVGGKNVASTVFASPATTETTITDSADSSPLADAEASLINDDTGTDQRRAVGVCATAVSMMLLMGMGWVMADRKARA